MRLIQLPNWFQIDFEIKTSPRATLELVFKLISKLKEQNLITKWFFLYEGKTIRVRFETTSSSDLQKNIGIFVSDHSMTPSPSVPFSPYQESQKSFDSEEAINSFANIMFELSELSIKRLSNSELFQPYKFLERISHCIFNNIYGDSIELYIKLKLLGMNFDNKDNPNQTIIDHKKQYLILEESQPIVLKGIRIPGKTIQGK